MSPVIISTQSGLAGEEVDAAATAAASVIDRF
jgi:hypothetical protein